MDTVSTPGRRRRWLRRPVTWILALVVLAAAGMALSLFQPWKLWIDRTVYEAVPAVAPAATGTASPPAAVEPVVLAHGSFISHEHTTTGTVRVLRHADGTRTLRLDDLNTSNGPALKVWLTDAAVQPGTAGWRVFDGSGHVDLGSLKGNIGSQNYPLPADIDLSRYRSVTIWCARFHVSFGAAELSG